jgi:hypothetical protein
MSEQLNKGLTRKPGRPRKYDTREERLRAQAACMKRRRNDARGGNPGKPGRPRKYNTREERQAADTTRRQKKRDEQALASALAAIEASERLR